MSSQILAEKTVAELVVERPSRSRVFEALRIDYCCGGNKPLSQACQEKNLELGQVTALLDAEASLTDAGPDPAKLKLDELCDHIEEVHHSFVKQELPRLGQMLAKVVAAHGHAYPWTLDMQHVYRGLHQEMDDHMAKEEQILFPMIRAIVNGEKVPMHCGSIHNPIRVMESEHDHAGEALRSLRALSNGYTAPSGACNTFRAMLDGLREFEEDLHIHIHKENNILHPRAIAAAGLVSGQAKSAR